MSSMVTKPTRTAIAALAFLLAATSIALAGPPWISIEYPANALDKETRGALALVRIYHHENGFLSAHCLPS